MSPKSVRYLDQNVQTRVNAEGKFIIPAGNRASIHTDSAESTNGNSTRMGVIAPYLSEASGGMQSEAESWAVIRQISIFSVPRFRRFPSSSVMEIGVAKREWA